LIPLSQVDPQRAMDLFGKVESPQPFPGMLDFPEDVRADAAIRIFTNYWRFAGQEGLPRIRQLATHIGDTGEYPYCAIGLVLAEVAKSKSHHTSFINETFREALQYYQMHSHVLNRNEEFLKFLQVTRPVVPSDLYEQALRIFVRRLTTEKSKNGPYVAEIMTTRGVVTFMDQNRTLLFKVFPLIVATDRQWANKVAQQYPEVQKSLSEIVYEAAGVVIGQPAKSDIKHLQDEALRLALVRVLEGLWSRNPSAATALAKRISGGSSLAFLRNNGRLNLGMR